MKQAIFPQAEGLNHFRQIDVGEAVTIGGEEHLLARDMLTLTAARRILRQMPGPTVHMSVRQEESLSVSVHRVNDPSGGLLTESCTPAKLTSSLAPDLSR